MEYNIRAYVDRLFEDAPDTQRAYEMKVELTQNLLDKYNDLVASGKSEEDAYNITIYGIGDISELLEEMRREEPVVVQTQGGVGYYTAMNYFRRRSARILGISVFLYIFCVVPVIVLAMLSDATGNELLGGLGVGAMFLCIAAATGMITWDSMTKPKKSDPPEIVMDLYSRRVKGGGPVLRAVQSSFWMLVLAVYLLLSFLTHRWDITWIIFIAAPAILGILSAIGRKE